VNKAILPAALLMQALTVLVSACSGGSSVFGKIASPPIEDLSLADLRTLVNACEKYAPNQAARGPYASAYCDQAISAYNVRTWSTPISVSHASTLTPMK